MDDELFQQMAAIERVHWWFVARRKIIAKLIKELRLPPRAEILDVGCGTGGNLPMLADFGDVTAIESNPIAISFAKKFDCARILQGKLPNDIPLEGRQFDLVLVADVLEHLRDDLDALATLNSLLKSTGWLLVTVPAFPFLWSHHDIQHGHYRRYKKDGVRALAVSAGFKPQVLTYFNTLLFPVVAALRMAQHVLGLNDLNELKVPSQHLNKLLCTILSSERHIIGKLPLPFGVSLLLLCRKGA